ncbi:MAG: serine/threonine protein kinase [Muribaculaceae bacterium]|nr:serine/threonine protein kinase [Muribaculaceae bacterium]
MNNIEDLDSGYLGEDAEISFTSQFTDIKVIRTTDFNMLARAKRHGRQWLLKGLPEQLRNSMAARRRLMKEFEIHSRLSHPGIARVMTCDEVENEGPCIVMEWIEGETLQDYLSSHRLSFSDRRRLLEEIVDAVGYMHSMGVAHRDLKPTNIMIRKAGETPVIIDFGLADTDDYIELKQSAGTTGYISPEQITNGGTQTSDDIYSLAFIIRLLCPEYSRIASHCLKPAGKRPNDGVALKKLLIDRRRRPRRIVVTLLTAVLTGLIFGGGFLIIQSKRQVLEALQASEGISSSNDANMKKVTLLQDSLALVTSRMMTLEDEKKKQEIYLSKIENAHKEGKIKIDNFFKSWDSNVISKIKADEDPAKRSQMIVDFSLKMQDFYKEMNDMIENYVRGLSNSGITPLDCERIKVDLKNYYYEINSNYATKWNKQITSKNQ